jgi:tRNA/tmRNA/rRNA uracil-C5-methylase (TrmA/RlmC/RlmD family)
MDYEVHVGSFFQANRFLLEALVEEVVSGSSAPAGLAVDLYCGVGLFTLPLAGARRESSVWNHRFRPWPTRVPTPNAQAWTM